MYLKLSDAEGGWGVRVSFDVVGFVHVDLFGMNSFVVANSPWANKAQHAAIQSGTIVVGSA